MPPAKKPVWDKFLSVTVNGVKKGKCKACNTEIVNNPVRLEAHLKKCAAKPDDEDVQQVDGPGPSKVLKQTTMDICISKSKQHEMDLSLVRYFVATNTPFNAAANKNFKDFVQKMKPGAVIPDRRRLAGELLDEVYEQEKEKVKNIGVMLDTLQSDQCTLSATFTIWKNVLSSAPIQYADSFPWQ